MRARRLRAGIAVAAAVSLAVAGCAESDRDDSGSSSGDKTLVFGVAGDAKALDPALASDGESFRVTRQIYETLVSIDSETGGPVAGLAESWTESEDGLRYTFTLRRGVRFHDGTELNAQAVLANFTRWLNLNDQQQVRSLQGFTQVFHHSSSVPKLPADNEKAQAPTDADSESSEAMQAVLEQQKAQLEAMRILFEDKLFTDSSRGESASYFGSVRATDTYTVELNLRRRLTGVIEAFTLPGLAIAAPASLTGGPKDNPAQSLAEKPVGTGPYRFMERTKELVRLELNKEYWNQDRVAANPQHPQRVELSWIAS